MKKIFTLLLCAVIGFGSCWGKSVTIGTGSTANQNFPINNRCSNYISQFIYLESEMGDDAYQIDSISFYYGSGNAAYTRKIVIYLAYTSYSSFGTSTEKLVNSNNIWGTQQVYSYTGEGYTLPSTQGWYSFKLATPFEWVGKSKTSKKNNILVCVCDETDSPQGTASKSHHVYSAGSNRGIYKAPNSSINPTSSTISGTQSSYIPKIKFTLVGSSPTPTYDTLTKVNVSDISSSSAKINWTKNESAKVKLQYVKHGQTDTTTVNDINAAFYVINSLSAETQYDYKAFAVYSTGISSAVAGSFTTTEASSHSHDGIDFTKWDATDALPTSAGNYYLTNNVSVSSWTVPSGDTKICLNGDTITFSSGYITVGSGKNLSIFDCKGTGAITANQSFNPAIKVSNGGNLSLFGGSISNTASGTDAFAVKLETGTFNIKGNIKMSTSASAANIRLANSSSVITLAGAITNTTKLSVNKAANSNITSGWSTQMSSADPADFFSSKNNDAPSVILVSGEAQLGVPSITINETGSNSIENNKLTDVNLVRTFKKGILNTIALPFALSDAKLQAAFGEDYELYKLSSSSLSSGVLELYFEQITALEGGKPYLLRINGDDDITNPSFSSVTLTTAHPRISTTAVDMIPVISESEITGASYNMYLNAAGELNWSTTTSSFKGMRAYFQVKGEMPSNVSVRRIVLGTDATTGLMQNAECTMQNGKMMVNGQLFIIKNGVKYNALGQIVK